MLWDFPAPMIVWIRIWDLKLGYECKYTDATLYQNNHKNSQWIEYDKLQKQFSCM